MDQAAIGKFIAEMRKEQGMTQRQLADHLCISDKAISKWECGNGFPEMSLLMPLCDILQITANELLSAQLLSSTDYQKKAEENIMNLIFVNAENKKKLILSIIVGAICIVAVVALVCLASFLTIPWGIRVLFVTLAIIVVIVGVGAAVVLDREAGTFECSYCQERFVPDMKAYIKGIHTITKRKLVCPHCGKKGMCKHIIIQK